MKKLVMMCMICLMPMFLLAQMSIQGTVYDSNMLPIPGISVVIKGTTEGVITDIDGKYKIEVSKGEILQFSYIGFGTKQIIVEKGEVIDVIMEEEAIQIGEVVVTALGIKKEKKALGYATTELKSKDITEVKSHNIVNSLSGKVAGLQVTGANMGVASSARVIIRGENSLNLDSNEPLFILDGIPVNNRIFGVGGRSEDQANLPTDYGNGISELNPDDFETVTILKGAAASALYGSRAANGVIVITTKKGDKREEGLGVCIKSSTMFSSALKLPELQNKYGGGWNLKYASDYGTNFGPRLNGNIMKYETSSGEFVEKPFANQYDLNDYFQTGISLNNTVSLSKAKDNFKYYFSYGNSYKEGIVPNTDLKGNSFRINTSYSITPRLIMHTNLNYLTRKSDNLTVSGYGSQGVMYALYWNYINVNLKELKDYWLIKDQKQKKLFSWADNPWFIAHENINAFKKQRLLGNIQLSYEINKDLHLMGRIGLDQSDDFRWSRRSVGAHRFPNGMYREQKIDFAEINADFLLTYEKILGDFDTKFSVGGNMFSEKINEGFLQGNGLAIPGIYNAQNIDVTPTLRNNIFEKRINSLYASASVGYQDFLYTEVSARNDWSSTLPTGNNSYFYPALSISFLPTSIFEMPHAISFMKLRFNIAQVGKDTDPYSLYKVYEYGRLPGTLTNPTQLPNAGLKPERTLSTEFGFETYLLGKRLGFDFTYYNSISKNQILNMSVSGANGYSSLARNAGEIKNSGIEISLLGKIIKTKDLEWGLKANFTKNKSEVKSLTENLRTFVIAEGPAGITVEARPGEQMGDIYGQGYLRNKEGEILYSKGLPLMSERKKIGNYNPDWMLGLSTNLNYKGLYLSTQFDIRNGGKIYSYTNAIAQESGILALSLPGREDGIIGKGVVKNSDGTFSPNDVKVAAETWYYGGGAPRENAEAHTFDASYLKMRELSIGYSFPKKLIAPLKLQELSIGFVGSNLFLWTDVPNIDPEAQALNGGSLLPGFEVVQLPSSRMYGFKVDIKF